VIAIVCRRRHDGGAMQEIDEKTDRLARLASAHGLGGILVNTQPNFAWLTGGRSNRIDGSRENGNGSLLVSARGERFVVANNIEMPRLREEALAGLDFTPVEYHWTAEHADASTAVRAARAAIGNGCEIGCDGPLPGGTLLDARIAAARAPLLDAELARYRLLGRDVGHAVGDACRALVPGLDENEVARRVRLAVECTGARAVVALVAADDRIARFRHPAPNGARWKQSVMVVICAQRDGLVVALSRIVSAGAPTPALLAQTEASGTVFGRLLDATRPGATGAELFEVAARAYDAVGFAGEEARHHQGGAIGYRSREWVAHPVSREVVHARQAFAWNPSVTGSKVEDTALVMGDEVELITSSPDWPALPICAGARQLAAAHVLPL
jgi:Xaa-Pro aminopeptidase